MGRTQHGNGCVHPSQTRSKPAAGYGKGTNSYSEAKKWAKAQHLLTMEASMLKHLSDCSEQQATGGQIEQILAKAAKSRGEESPAASAEFHCQKRAYLSGVLTSAGDVDPRHPAPKDKERSNTNTGHNMAQLAPSPNNGGTASVCKDRLNNKLPQGG